MNVDGLFCLDDYDKSFQAQNKVDLIESEKKRRNGKTRLSHSEIMTILVLFHQSGFRHLKWFYRKYGCVHLKKEFPNWDCCEIVFEIKEPA